MKFKIIIFLTWFYLCFIFHYFLIYFFLDFLFYIKRVFFSVNKQI